MGIVRGAIVQGQRAIGQGEIVLELVTASIRLVT